MFSLVLALVLSQTVSPPEVASGHGVVVMSSRRQGLTSIEVITLTDRLSKALQDARVRVEMSPDEALSRLGPQKRPESCQGKPECLAELGRALGVAAVVSLDASKVFDDLPLRIMLLDTRQGQVLLRRSYTVSSARPAEWDTAFQEVGREIQKSLTELYGPEAPPPTDVPRQPAPVALTPEPVQAPPPGLTVPAQQPSRVPVYLARGGAVVAGGAAVYFLVSGLNQASELKKQRVPGVSEWTHAQAVELRDDANRQLLLSGIFAGVAGALLATSFLLPAPEPAE